MLPHHLYQGQDMLVLTILFFVVTFPKITLFNIIEMGKSHLIRNSLFCLFNSGSEDSSAISAPHCQFPVPLQVDQTGFPNPPCRIGLLRDLWPVRQSVTWRFNCPPSQTNRTNLAGLCLYSSVIAIHSHCSSSSPVIKRPAKQLHLCP